MIEQSGLSESVVNALIQEALPFTYAEVQALIQAQENESLKDQLVTEASAYRSEAEALLNELQLRYIEAGKTDSLLSVFETFDTLGLMRYRKALLYSALDQPQMMESELELLAEEEPEMSQTIGTLITYLQLLQVAKNADKEVFDTAYLSSVQSLKGETDQVGIWAAGAMYRAGVDTLYEYLPVWDSTQYRMAEPENLWSKVRWSERNDFALWPNPANRSVSISWKNSAIKEVHFQLYSLKGVLVKETNLGLGANVSIEDIPNGHYTATITNQLSGEKHRSGLVICR